MPDEIDEPWYAVRCIVRFPAGPTEDERPIYEERITLWRAESFEDAETRAIAEAIDYAADLRGDYVDFAQTFHLAVSEPVGEGHEIFSLMRNSELSPDDYVARFFTTGSERQSTHE